MASTTAATVDLAAIAGHDAAALPKIDPDNHVVMLDNCACLRSCPAQSTPRPHSLH